MQTGFRKFIGVDCVHRPPSDGHDRDFSRKLLRQLYLAENVVDLALGHLVNISEGLPSMD